MTTIGLVGRAAIVVLAVFSLLLGPVSVTGYGSISCENSYGRPSSTGYVEVPSVPTIQRIDRNNAQAYVHLDFCTGGSNNAVIIVRCTGSDTDSFWSAMSSPVRIFGLDPLESYSCAAAVRNEAGQSPWSDEVPTSEQEEAVPIYNHTTIPYLALCILLMALWYRSKLMRNIGRKSYLKRLE